MINKAYSVKRIKLFRVLELECIKKQEVFLVACSIPLLLFSLRKNKQTKPSLYINFVPSRAIILQVQRESAQSSKTEQLCNVSYVTH